MSALSSTDIIVGIDLGTTNSCVAYYHNNSAETIEDPTGAYTVPSIVSFTPHERHIGRAAAPQRETNAKNLIFGCKRLIGQSMLNTDFAEEVKLWPYRIEADEDGISPICIADYLGKERKFFPEEISAMVLSHIKDYASTRIGQPVNHCVITVPAYFNDLQRNQTKNAGTIAGWNVIRVINEPTAAAFDYAYGELSRDPSFDKTILIFDLGGGTFDVSIIRLYQGMVKTLSTCGNSHFGGEDFDNVLTQFLLEKVNSAASAENNGEKFDLRDKINKYARLRQEAVRAKEAMASCERTMINLQDIHAACQNFELTRAVFDKLCQNLYNLVLPLVEQAVNESGISKEHIDDVVLVGGSSRLQKVRDIVKDYFPDGKLRTLVANPDQAIARGAAIIGASFSTNPLQTVNGIEIKDITSHPINIGKAKRQTQVILPKHTQYPTQARYTVKKQEGMESLVVTFFEGEGKTTDQCSRLGSLRLDNLDPEADECDYEVQINVNESGIITAGIKDPITGQQEKTVFTSGGNDTADIEKKRERFIEFEAESNAYKLWTIRRGEIIEKVSGPAEILEGLTDLSSIPAELVDFVPHFQELVSRLKECEALGIEYQEYFEQLCIHISQYEPLINCLASMETFDDFDF